MPAPTPSSIEGFLTASLITQGFVKKSYDEDGNLVDSKELPDDMKKIVKALSVGLAQQWQTWSQQVVVVVPVTGTAGTPSQGIIQ